MKTLYTRIYESAKYLHNRELKTKINCILRGLKINNKSLVCSQFGISRRTYYYWLSRLKESNFDPNSLLPKSKAPKRRPREIRGVLKSEILKIRKEFRYCAWKISWYLKEIGLKVSPHGVHNVLVREKVPFKKRRGKKPNKHKRRYSLETPGENVQVDIKYVPFLIQGQRAYEFNAIDDCTRWRFAYLYSNINQESSLDFAKRLIDAAPFTIKSIQTDNDIAFTNRFMPQTLDYDIPHPLDKFLSDVKITHKLIPPGIKELNGKVERSHKTDMDEFYWKIHKNISFDNLQNQLANWIQDYNNSRPHSALMMRTPAQRLVDFGIQLNKPKLLLKNLHKNPPMAAIFANKLKLAGKDNSYFINKLPYAKRKRKSLLERALEFMEVPNLLHDQCNLSGTSTIYIGNRLLLELKKF